MVKSGSRGTTRTRTTKTGTKRTTSTSKARGSGAKSTGKSTSKTKTQPRSTSASTAKRTTRRTARRRPSDAPNRSEFIRKNLLENPEYSAKELAQIWKKSGFPGSLTSSLVYQVKGRMGKQTSGSRRRTSKPTRAQSSRRNRSSRTTTGQTGRWYLEAEQTLDRMIAQADQIGDTQLVEDLRQARRRTSLALV